jgi:hypothetical protein
MGIVGRDVYRRKLERDLARLDDECAIESLAAIDAFQEEGGLAPFDLMPDLPPESRNAELGSPYNFPPWTRETLVNELLATPKARGLGTGGSRRLRHDRYAVFQRLVDIQLKLENAEDGVFLAERDVFEEMPRLAQRQFEWQRGVANAPTLYRSTLLYGSDTAADFFESDVGVSVSKFVKVGAFLFARFRHGRALPCMVDLSSVGVTAAMWKMALARFSINLPDARSRAATMRRGSRHTAYRPSILRDHPIIAFGGLGGRLRAPIADLIMYRYTTGLYLDVVRGGAAVWTGIGERFERYVLDYLGAMMAPYVVAGETIYGPKKTSSRTPDILVLNTTGAVVAAIECKAKRMTFDARFSDDPVADAAIGFDELAKGIFQLWRFFSHARLGLTGKLRLSPDCQGIMITADSWLMMARDQAVKVLVAANRLADASGGIAPEDRRDIAFCPIHDVEFSLQHGTADSFLTACRDVASGERKGWMLSPTHGADLGLERPYPFLDRIADLLPWMGEDVRA